MTRRAALAATVLLVAFTSAARAHIGHTITRAERYLKLDATEADTRFVVSLTLGAAEGRGVLAQADADESGTVDEAEMTTYLATWGEGLRTELPIEVDGAPLEVTWTDGWMDPIGAVRAVPVTVEMVAHLPLSGREHRVVVRDRMVRREVFDRTDLAFRAHDGAELVRCGPEAEPEDVEDDAAFLTGGAALDVMTADLRYPSRAVGPPVWATFAGAFAIGLVVVLVVVGRRARAKAAGPGSPRAQYSSPQVRDQVRQIRGAMLRCSSVTCSSTP